MEAKKAVERLDSLKSVHEMELGNNQYVKVSTLVECVNKTLDSQNSVTEIQSDTPTQSVEDNDPENKREHEQNVSEDPGIPPAFRSFLRRFSETNGIDETELDPR
ncbi:hypothetical protein AVEN_154062-1 [Araneus ventricosus]|uniref:Uncharacterized protein n=1 Tax=Araneus ventricosus TaxID=182803 RepID=A0A4Y2IZN3_ARAVE|nr:hypothetical protein AVEN_154062-1 [Araneus ventricosus]